MDDALDGICLDDNSVLAQLFLDEDNLFCAFDDEITTWIQWTFGHACKLRLGTPRQDALVTTQHDGQTTDVHVLSPHDILSAGILNRDEDGGAVRYIP